MARIPEQARDERAQLRAWLAAEGYPRLAAKIAVCGTSPEGAQAAGSAVLIAFRPAGAVLVDRKTNAAGDGLGLDGPQLKAYATLLRQALPDAPARGAVVRWADHGRLEVVAMDGGAAP